MIKLKSLKEIPELNQPIALVGFPGIAMVGKLAIINIVSTLNAIECCEVYHDDLPPHILIDQKGEMRLPKISIFYLKNDSFEIKHDLVLFTADYQPTSSAGIYQLSDYICSFCKKLGVINIISTGAFVPEKLIETFRQVYVSGTSEEFINFFLESKTKKTILLESGYITGANGIIPAWGKIHYNIEGVSILAETLPMRPLDPVASKAILEVLNERYNINADLSDLDQQIEEVDFVSAEVKKKLKEERIKSEKATRPYIS
ncbi:MAG: PAC2 family protein [Candidatus Helarchaeota archaeon]